MPKMKGLGWRRDVDKAKRARLENFIVKAEKFLDHTGLVGDGYFCTGFDPDYHFAGPDYRHSFIIDATAMNAILKVFEHG